MFGRHYQQQSSYPVNFSVGKPSTILLSPAGIPQQHFPHPRVSSIFISLPAGNPHILPRQNRGKISMQVSSTEMGDRVRVQFPVPDIYFGM